MTARAVTKPNRIFVPLNTEAFEWFRSGGKSYELRKIRGQFSTKHVYPGRRVELRKGYSGESIWGHVGKVFENDDLHDLIDFVGPKNVIPNAESLESATTLARSIVGSSGPYIAFEVRRSEKETRKAGSNQLQLSF